MSDPLLHVLVLNWNGREHIEACLASVLESSYGNLAVILVDNASDDDSVAFVQERFGADPRVRTLLCPRNLGWSGGNNFAMERSLAAGAEYLLLLNNDTAIGPGAMEALVRMARARPAIGALAPKMVLFDYPDVLNSVGLECSIIGASWDKGVGRLDAPRWNASEPVIGVCGGACLLRAEALRKTGLLPEDFEIYLDDLDLCLRVWNAGYEIWSCPEAVVRHKFSATWGQGKRARRKYYLNTRNRFWVVMRNYPLSRIWIIKPALAVGEARAVGRALLDGEPWRVWAHTKAWAAAAGYLPRALAERWRRRRAGLGACRFWPLVRRDRMFCPRIELPVRGWYKERTVAGKRLRPMSLRAWEEVRPGRLRLTHANCYPELGKTEIHVTMNGVPLIVLSTDSVGEEIIETGGGRLEFEARFIFDADKTGEVADFGGWVQVEPI